MTDFYDTMNSLRSRVNWTIRDIISLMAEIGYSEHDKITELILQSVKSNIGDYVNDHIPGREEV